MFVGVMLMFVGVMNFGQVQKIRFVVVKIFRSNSNQFLVILIWSSELASLFFLVGPTFKNVLMSPKLKQKKHRKEIGQIRFYYFLIFSIYLC